ncbi:hypothetical protein LRY60_01140, partial [Candidatus Woesebacteria bacterium]|nr:hypothetical protein [Candidatus Woesebacteria bacterium]
MRLYEYEAKHILEKHDVAIPNELSRGPVAQLSFEQPAVLKGQVLFGNRKQAGLIHLVHSETDFTSATQTLAKSLQEQSLSPERTDIVIEELIPYTDEVYLAIRYDTRTRLPVILFSADGGSGIEERSEHAGLQTYPLQDLAKTKLPQLHPHISAEWLQNFVDMFFAEDMTLMEINPLVFVENQPIALDAKIELDDTAAFRHPEWENYPPRTLFEREPTEREQAAKRVNALDHRGVAGAAYFEFPGTVGILASGGGASLLAMDALLTTDIRPANYTEYSGNPTREKVHALSEIVMSQEGLEGLWVIGGHANFTDIYETLMGVLDAVESASETGRIRPGFPVVIRRGGPRQEEAFAECKKRAQQLNIALHLYDSSFPITDTVAVLEDAVHAYQK